MESEAVLTRALTRAISRGVLLAAALGLLWFFLDAALIVVLSFIAAAVFAIALTPPVNWLEKRHIPRGLATILVLLGLVGVFVGLGFLVAPQIAAQTDQLTTDLPRYANQAVDRVRSFISHYPRINERIQDLNVSEQILGQSGAILSRVGRYSLSAIGFVVAAIVFLATVTYMIAMPRALLRGMLQAVPGKHRTKFAAAFTRGSDTVVGWVWANAVIGAIEGVAAAIFLTIIGVPGAWVWGLVTLFAELIPQLGSTLMAIPPTIIALAVDPPKALWVILFYVLLQQAVNNLLAPTIRARTMNIHPVSELFAVLGFAAAFGIIGAILADPVLGFIKAFYDEFYGNRNDTPALDDLTERVLQRDTEALQKGSSEVPSSGLVTS